MFIKFQKIFPTAHLFGAIISGNFSKRLICIDVRKGVLGGLTPPLRLKIWADPPSWKIFEQVTP